MGLVITTTTNTSKGDTSTLYLKILEFYQNKEGKLQLPVKYYKLKEDIEVDVFEPFEKVFTYQLENIEGGLQELTDGVSKKDCYSKIKATLTAALKLKGFEEGDTVIDDI